MGVLNCTIYKNIYDEVPYHITIQKCFDRIKNGNSKSQVERLRATIDKDKAKTLKYQLPSVSFSGLIKGRREDGNLYEHNGYFVLDFDNVGGADELNKLKKELSEFEYIWAIWVSPSGNGIKALVKIADKSKHLEHYEAIKEVFPKIDISNKNKSRACFESYDPDIIIKPEPTVPFTKILVVEKVEVTIKNENSSEIFSNLLKWLSNKGDTFSEGSRNLFLCKLTSACCRFGVSEGDCFNLIQLNFLSGYSKAQVRKAERTVSGAYKKFKHTFGTATFENSKLTDKISKKEVQINDEIDEDGFGFTDVIYGEDVKQEAVDIYDIGYKSAETTFIPPIDIHFKWKRGELTLLSGIGNYGKSTFEKYLLLMKVIGSGCKFALFSPEDNPAAEFYHDLVEIYLGQNCTPDNPNRPNKAIYERTYDLISKHIFYVYPKKVSPTPEYIKSTFLKLITEEKIDGCIIDPFNQLTNDYNKNQGRTDQYLEHILSDFHRFAMDNNVYFHIIAHPTKMIKESGNYICPDVFDLAGGAMWNNKMDNIYIYHRPNRGTEPTNPLCELHAKKIRRQKIVGKLGTLVFDLKPLSRRYIINGVDYMEELLLEKEKLKYPDLPLEPTRGGIIQPSKDFLVSFTEPKVDVNEINGEPNNAIQDVPF